MLAFDARSCRPTQLVTASEIAPNTDLIVTAHKSRLSVAKRLLARWQNWGASDTTLTVVPSRDRGGGMTIREGDPIAGGSIYHPADCMDAGAIAAQTGCSVKKGETGSGNVGSHVVSSSPTAVGRVGSSTTP